MNVILFFLSLKLPYSFVKDRYLVLDIAGKFFDRAFRIQYLNALSVCVIAKSERLWNTLSPFTKMNGHINVGYF